jgi:DNA-binding NarL/FixJ family response regulator
MVVDALRITLSQESDIEIVGAQTTVDQVEEQILQSGANLLLLDASIDTARLTTILSTVRTVARSIVLSQDPDPDLMHRCVTAGAAGYLIGPQTLPDLLSSIRHVQDAWVVLTPEQVSSLVDRAPWRTCNERAAEVCAKLSVRERDVLQLLAAGASAEEIGRQLLISANTVQSHLKNVMRKLNVRSKLAAVVMALSAGAIEPPGV